MSVSVLYRLRSYMITSRQARALALLALLFVAGLQVAEAGHDHGADDSFSQCLLCKVSVDDVVTAAAAGTPCGLIAQAVVPGPDAPTVQSDASPFDARGPPLHS